MKGIRTRIYDRLHIDERHIHLFSWTTWIWAVVVLLSDRGLALTLMVMVGIGSYLLVITGRTK